MLETNIQDLLKGLGVADIGFAKPEDGPLPYAVSLVVKLSDAVVEEITDAPTHSYFHHYRTVNAFLDQAMLRLGMLLEQQGYRYLPVGASQSINTPGKYYEGRYSHKKVACLAGLGTIGCSDLFLHKQYGPRVRLGTVFTDCELESPTIHEFDPCANCGRCVAACPSGAIKGGVFSPETGRDALLDPKRCSDFMKERFRDIGRGAVCGICMAVCPVGARNRQ